MSEEEKAELALRYIAFEALADAERAAEYASPSAIDELICCLRDDAFREQAEGLGINIDRLEAGYKALVSTLRAHL
jgi:hypothetical protein